MAELYKFSQVTQEKKVYNLKIPFTKAKRFQIIKNTLANAKYDKNFSIQNESNSFFKFEFAAKFPGLYEGIIHIEDDEKIHAYQIIVNVDESIEG